MIGIYKITNPVGEIYIGQSIDIKKRWYHYRLYLAKQQRKLYLSFMVFGYESHLFEIVEICERHKLNELELYYISLFNTCYQLNCSPGNKIYRTKEQIKRDLEEDKIKRQNKAFIKAEGKKLRYESNRRWIEKYKTSQAKKTAILNRCLERINSKKTSVKTRNYLIMVNKDKITCSKVVR